MILEYKTLVRIFGNEHFVENTPGLFRAACWAARSVTSVGLLGALHGFPFF